MGLMIFGLIVIILGSAVILQGFQSGGDSFFLSLGVLLNLGGIVCFLVGAKQYFVQDLLIELKKMNGEVILKSTDGWSFGPDKKPAK